MFYPLFGICFALHGTDAPSTPKRRKIGNGKTSVGGYI